MKKYYKPKQSSVYVDGENFVELYPYLREANFCGTGRFMEAIRENDLKMNSKIFIAQTTKGLNDSLWSYYYPEASEQEIKESNFIETEKHFGNQPLALNIRKSKRAKIPKPTLLCTIRYDY